MREKRRKEDYKKEWHTWESNSREYSKRLDSFWGKFRWLKSIDRVETVQREMIHSDHKLIFINVKVSEDINREEELVKGKHKINNKQRCENMKEKDWEEYRKIVKEEIEKTNLKEVGEIDTKVNIIGKIVNEGLKKVYEEREKEEEIIEVEERNKKEEFD